MSIIISIFHHQYFLSSVFYNQYFPSYLTNSKSIKIKLDLSNYAIKTDLKNLNADTSSFALKTNLTDLKTKVNKINLDKINSIDALQGKTLVKKNHFVFEPKYKYFKNFLKNSTECVSSWESKGLFNEKVVSTKIENTDFSPQVYYYSDEIGIKFNNDFLKKESILYEQKQIANIYVVYERSSYIISSTISFHNCLLGAITVTRNGNIDTNKHKYSGYGLAFSSKTYLHKDSGKRAYDLIIFGADLSSSAHAENKKNNVLVLGENSVKLNNTTIIVEDVIKTNCTVPNKKSVLPLHYNGNNSYLFVNGVQQ